MSRPQRHPTPCAVPAPSTEARCDRDRRRRPRSGAAAALLTGALLGGCAAPPSAAVPPGSAAGSDRRLAGTRWQLVAIESMSDGQPTVRPADPARYTVRFGSDGRASFGLDCNRGSADWHSEPARGGASGALTFGALTATRARCPPPSLEPRVVRDLPFVRSFLLRDGRLHLALFADGGIYTWAPLP